MWALFDGAGCVAFAPYRDEQNEKQEDDVRAVEQGDKNQARRRSLDVFWWPTHVAGSKTPAGRKMTHT